MTQTLQGKLTQEVFQDHHVIPPVVVVPQDFLPWKDTPLSLWIPPWAKWLTHPQYVTIFYFILWVSRKYANFCYD
jgi:hypothetical protein